MHITAPVGRTILKHLNKISVEDCKYVIEIHYKLKFYLPSMLLSHCIMALYYFPITAVSNYHKLSSL